MLGGWERTSGGVTHQLKRGFSKKNRGIILHLGNSGKQEGRIGPGVLTN